MDYFNDIVCINLDISTDRRKHAEHYFEKLNIPARFFTAKKHEKGGMYGCFDSHIQILSEAYKKNLDNILVFEDDFLPTPAYSEDKLLKAIEFMKTHDDWDIFHLGYSFVKDDKNGAFRTIFHGNFCNEDIVQFNPMLTQTLCYSRRAIKKIIENYHEYIGIMHYDAFICNHLDFKNYCIVPMIFDQNFYFQHNNESIDGVEYFARFCFPLLACTKLNYRITLLKYWYNKYKLYNKYIYMIVLSFILYKIKCQITMEKNIIKK